MASIDDNVKLAATGDVAAFEELYRRHYRRVYSLCFRMTHSASAAEDLKFGKIWLLPYDTGKDPSQSHPTAFTWYDELIISRTQIADPQ